jgi:2-hydroxychromene-2-carboxylate isomerase
MIRAHLVALLFGQEYLLIRRSFRKMIRYGKISLDVYIAADDPQSYVLLQALAKLKQNYDIHANILILDNNLNAWATSRDIELAWCVKDSALFACVYNLNSPQLNACSRSDWAVRAAIVRNMIAKCILNASSSDSKIISSVLDCMDYLWGSKWDNDFIQATASIDTSTYDDMFVRNKNRLLSHGYYGPGMIEMEREFYGPSRLHHLERRLLEEYGNLPAVQNIPLSGIDVYMHNNNSAFNFPTMIFNKEIEPLYYPCDNSSNIVDRNIITNQNAQFDSNQQTNKEKVKLYFSFRSPYSQLVLPRLLKMCQYYNVEIEICPLMPMVLRGLAVPVAKEEYITSDVVRESRMWNIPFGCIVDPSTSILVFCLLLY